MKKKKLIHPSKFLLNSKENIDSFSGTRFSIKLKVKFIPREILGIKYNKKKKKRNE